MKDFDIARLLACSAISNKSCGDPMMRKAGLEPHAVTITAGANETNEGLNFRVAKRILASTVAVALDAKRLQVVATGPHVEILRNELRAFHVKVSATQNESFKSWRKANHDDLVLATAIAIWASERLWPRVKVNPKWRLIGRN